MTTLQDKINRVAELTAACADLRTSNWSKDAEVLTRMQRTGGEGGPCADMLCTYYIGSDRYADKVVSVSASGHQLRTERGYIYTRRQDGQYRPKGENCGQLRFFIHEDYRDPSF